MKQLCAIGLGLGVSMVSVVPVQAAGDDAGQYGGSRIPLGCMMIDGTVIAITNTSGATIPEGTAITYDGLSSKYGQHSLGVIARKVVGWTVGIRSGCMVRSTSPVNPVPAASPTARYRRVCSSAAGSLA